MKVGEKGRWGNAMLIRDKNVCMCYYFVLSSIFSTNSKIIYIYPLSPLTPRTCV
jgi:hypothetical protein